jgi:hypothetical protein
MISIEINNTGSAFDEPHQEVARILRELANSIEQGVERTTLYDINGNRCGKVLSNIERE